MSYSVTELKIGQSESISKTITEADIILFAAVSTDTNPAHLDEVYAANSQFKGRIAHGMLSAGLISAVLGTQLPGFGTIYLSQSLRFKAPVRPGDTVTATVTVRDIQGEKNRATFETVCTVAGKTVIEGEATVLCPVKG